MIIQLSKFGEQLAYQLSTPKNPINILYLYDSEEVKLQLKNPDIDNQK